MGFIQQRKLIAAEHDRLTEQLQHERKMSDRAHLRAAISTTAERYEEALVALFEARAAAEAEADEPAVSAWGRLLDSNVALQAAERRLSLWISNESQLKTGLETAVTGLRDAQYALKGAPPLTDEAATTYTEAMQTAAKGVVEFMAAARNEVGVSV